MYELRNWTHSLRQIKYSRSYQGYCFQLLLKANIEKLLLKRQQQSINQGWDKDDDFNNLIQTGNIFQHHLMKLTIKIIKLITSMHLHSKVYTLKIINVNLVLYLLIIDKSKTAAVHPNDCREMKLTEKGKQMQQIQFRIK